MNNFTKILEVGSEGPEVLEAKKFLISHGFNKVYMNASPQPLSKGEGQDLNKPYVAVLQENDYYSEVMAAVVDN